MGGIFSSGKSSAQNTVAPMEASLRVSTSAYGLAVPIVYGTNRVPANMIWYGAFTAIPHTTTSSSGGGKGGGGGGGGSNTTYTYTASMALAVSEGAINTIGKVWKDKQVYASNSLFSVFRGDDAQSAWGYLSSNYPDQALVYPHIAYVAAANYDLGDSSSTPNHSLEVLGVLTDGESPQDVRPADILTNFLTNQRYGCNWSGSKLGDWYAYEQYTYASRLLFSPVVDAARPAQEFLSHMAKLTNSGIYFSEGLLKITPYGDQTVSYNGVTYTPDLTPVYAFSDSDFIYDGNTDPVTVERIAPADCYNQVQLEFVNRANEYNVEVSEAKDQANIEAYGLRTMEAIKAHEIADADVARRCAQTFLQRSVYIRNRYEFTVGAKFCLLEPTDYVTITDSTLGLVAKPVRIITIEENEDYTFHITAEDAPYGVSSTAEYPSEGSDGHINDYNVSPGDTAAPLVFNAPAQLTTTGLEVWVAAYGTDPNWGGCEVWASYDNSNYARIGAISAPARMGTLTSALATGSDPDTTHTLAVNIASHQSLTSVSQVDADNKVTLSYVDGELMSYQNATLTGTDAYNLTYLRRGCYGTSAAAHASGTKFCRLDDAIFKYAFTPDKVGKTLYLKFPAFNIYGTGMQQLADVSATTFTITASISKPADVSSFAAAYSYPNVTLTWAAAAATSNIKQYIIKRGSSWATATTIAVVSGSQNSYVDPAAGIGTYTYWIAAVDDAGVQSNAPQYSSVAITQIAALGGLAISAGFQSFFLQYTQPTDAAFAGVMVWVSTTSTFTPSAATLVYTGPDTLVVVNKDGTGQPLSSTTTYYVKAAAYSKLGTGNLNYSSSLAVTPIDVVVDIPPGSITTTEIADDSITTPKILALAITGDKIAANSIVASKIVAGTITGDKIATNTVTANNIDSRGLSIKDAAGNVIFAAGTNLTSSYITPASGWLNTNISIGSNGALSGGGGGQVTIGGLGYTGDLAATKNIISYSSTAPASPSNGDIWVDTSVTPNVAKVRVSGAWQLASNYTTNTNQLTDGANLGGTATWSGVSGTGKPADNATKNTVTYSGTAPTSPTDGDIWVDTTSAPYAVKVRISAAWQTASNLTTNTNQLTDGANLGGTAVWSGVSGTGKPADGATKNIVTYSATAPTSPTDGDIWVDTTTSPAVAKVRVSGAWQSAANLTTNTNQLTDGANLGGTATWTGVTGTGKPADNATKNTIYRQATAPASGMSVNDVWFNTSSSATYYYDGTAWQLAGDKTSANTAAAISNQGAFATLNQITAANVSTYIAAAAITNAYIGDVIQSTAYVAGSAGWKIDKTGAAELNNATFRGTLNIKSATTGARVEMTNSVIKVYDSTGVLRVKIGDLSA